MTDSASTAARRSARSTLFVPASSPSMIPKAAASVAEAVCIDLEDSVPPPDKAAARRTAIDALNAVSFGGRWRIVRINAIDGGFAYRDVVEVVEEAGDRLDAVMIPKVASARDIVFVDMLLAQIEASKRLRPVRLEAQIESARGFLEAREIAAASPRLDALIFGPGDYAASMGMPSGAIGERDADDEAYPGDRWHAVMHTIVAAARANGLRCIDGPYAGFRDAAGLERACRIARAMGFDGKQCIHPAQLATVNAAFTPGDAEVSRAAALVAAYESSVEAGQGVAVHEGRMIDAASLRMARTILDRAGTPRP